MGGLCARLGPAWGGRRICGLKFRALHSLRTDSTMEVLRGALAPAAAHQKLRSHQRMPLAGPLHRSLSAGGGPGASEGSSPAPRSNQEGGWRQKTQHNLPALSAAPPPAGAAALTAGDGDAAAVDVGAGASTVRTAGSAALAGGARGESPGTRAL